MNRLLGALMWLASGAQAATCSASTSLMAFGLYDTVSTTANDTTAQVTVVCTPGSGDPLTTPYVLTVAGTGTGNDSVRAVLYSASRLYYQVYKDAGRSQVWGNGGSSGAGVAGSVTSVAALAAAQLTHTAYARMPAHQVVPPGLYGGSLLVTVDY